MAPDDRIADRRHRPRTPALSEHMMEFALPGFPLYQLKLRDISETGAGVIVRPESKFLERIQIGQEVRMRLISPRGSRFRPGDYRGRVTQITDLSEGKYRGHRLVGIALAAEEPA